MPEEIRARFAPSAEARAQYPEEQWLIEAWTPAVKPWYAIQEQAYARGLVSDIQIGGARCLFFQVPPVIELSGALCWSARMRCMDFTHIGDKILS